MFLPYSFSSVLKVIRVTGFMKGLYTDFELKSDNVKVGMELPYFFSFPVGIL